MKTIKTELYSFRVYVQILATAIILHCFSYASAQDDLPCANEHFQTKQLLEDSSFLRQLVTYYSSIGTAVQRNNGVILEIPLAVHVLHLGEPVGTGTNISDQQIYDAVQGANERWRKINTTDGVDMEVQFCLAQFDPDGNPSNGIIRKDASAIPLYSDIGIGYIEALLEGIVGADEIAVKNFSNWPHSYVYNIWVVNKIAGGWGGYAFFPLPNGEYSTDGTVITAGAMRYTSSTLAHELGHGMGLLHTFQGSENGCPANDLCFLQGDFICDTPPHKRTDCANSNCNSSPDSLFSFKNTMSYCSGRGLFTQGQKDRVRTTIYNSSRNQLLVSTACTGLVTSVNNPRLTEDKISLFPNPASKDFNLNLAVTKDAEYSIRIVNILGQTVKEQSLSAGNNHLINIEDLTAKGMYKVLILQKNNLVKTLTLSAF